MERDKRSIEAALLVCPGNGLDIIAIESWSLRRMDLGKFSGADIADEFDGHVRFFRISVRSRVRGASAALPSHFGSATKDRLARSARTPAV